MKFSLRFFVAAFLLICAMAFPIFASGDMDKPISSDGRKLPPGEAVSQSTKDLTAGFRGLIAQGATDDSMANFPARWETPREFSLLLRRKTKSATGSAETILGTDLRSRFYSTVYPHRAIGLITFDQPGLGSFLCTGWLISPNTVATAGHCVHSGGLNGNFSTNVVFFPARDGASTPNGSCAATSLFAVAGWTDSALASHDYGAIKLNCTIGNTVGWFGLTKAAKKGDHALVAGYPGDKPLEQWGSFGAISATDMRQLYYFNDTFGGMSGSPVYQPDSRGSACKEVCAMAIHAYGIGGPGKAATQNHGPRITKAVYNNFLTWIAAP
jgi:glutamyl endopeptidase